MTNQTGSTASRLSLVCFAVVSSFFRDIRLLEVGAVFVG